MTAAKVKFLKTARSESRRDGPGGHGADRYRLFFEEANDALLVVNPALNVVVEANAQMAELTGYLRSELEGASLSLITPERGAPAGRSTPLSAEKFKNDGFYEDICISGKDGKLRFISLSVRAVDMGGEAAALCILRDIGAKRNMEREILTKHQELRNAYVELEKTHGELKAMQETLVQSGKLAALGELTAGIAHELNQPLTAIKGFAQEAQTLIKAMATAGPGAEGDRKALADYLGEVEKGASKMERIISHLRGFTRKSTEDFRDTDIHEVINEALKMLEQQFKSRGIVVERRYAADLPHVWANPFQLEQVFINLATNARDAIEAKKERRGKVMITSSHADGVVNVRFEDNGVGIPDHLKSKIFNPFFTTKEVGKGMGLGLSISYGILSKLNASLFAESEAGKGTAFTVRLPVDYRKL